MTGAGTDAASSVRDVGMWIWSGEIDSESEARVSLGSALMISSKERFNSV